MSKELLFSATKKDFRVDTFCAGGPGGQHQNKTASGVRITHLATGLVGECRESRSQHQNKKIAFRRLATLLVNRVVNENKADHERSAVVIRTYNEPDNRVKDNASGLVLSYKGTVGGGDIAELVEARKSSLTVEE